MFAYVCPQLSEEEDKDEQWFYEDKSLLRSVREDKKRLGYANYCKSFNENDGDSLPPKMSQSVKSAESPVTPLKLGSVISGED